MSINDRIEEFRIKLQMSKNQFAHKIDVSPQTYSNYVSGRDIPSNVLQKAIEKFEIDPNWLLLGKKVQKTKIILPDKISEEIIKNINLKLFNFPLKAIVGFIFVLEEKSNIENIKDLENQIKEFYEGYKGIIKFKLTSNDFTTKLDSSSLIYYINCMLTDRDVQIIFKNKGYFLNHLNFIKQSKRWI